MSSRLLDPSSKISTHRRCDNCGVTIDQVAWKQCRLCSIFDLCDECGELSRKSGYDKLLSGTRHRHAQRHQKMNENGPINNDSLELVLVEQGEHYGKEDHAAIREKKLQEMLNKEEGIRNDYEMSIVMEKLRHMGISASSGQTESDKLNSLIAGYQLKASQRNIRILSLDGGGVRGYMPIQVLVELITQKHLSGLNKFDSTDKAQREPFRRAQKELTDQFDYFAGTSAGGLIAFCLAMNYNILDMREIFSRSSYFFKRNLLGPIIYSKYDPSRIHQKIDEIINGIQSIDGTPLSAEHATLLDIRNLLNPHNVFDEKKAELVAPYHANFLEFVDDKNFKEVFDSVDEDFNLHRAQNERVLLITAYNTETNSINIFNTSYSKHWGYRIADVLKATMAAPTYFPPQQVYPGKKVDGRFQKEGKLELYIDGGVFANDPELAALWAIRMQWKKPANYNLVSIGTGSYTTSLPSSSWGGYAGWIFNKVILVDTLMNAPGAFTQTVVSNLAKFNDTRRIKLNYRLTRSMNLDDGKFITDFDQEWETLKNEPDFKALIYFYDRYINQHNSNKK